LIGSLLGGIGIFLIGMLLLTDGLKGAAGDRLRDLLQRFARGPISAILIGAVVTVLVQSSSATVLTTIGFVSAGLLSFPQAIGVIIGANLGTTSTGWFVSLVGFKLSLTAVALPIVGVGALLRVLGGGKRAHAGGAIAGFGLIFVGIDILQVGMGGLAEQIDLSKFSAQTWSGKAILMTAGFVMTVVMQSSSAAVATSLAAVHAGTLDIEQAALLVIGQNVGTTVTAILASVGAAVRVKRTALAHILFNVITALLVLLLYPLILALITRVASAEGPAVAIALFHTSFSLIGTLVFFPFLGRFATLIERILPERVPSLVSHLDPSVARVPGVAIEAARRSGLAILQLLFESCRRRLASDRDEKLHAIPASTDEAIVQMRDFVAIAGSSSTEPAEHDRHIALIHLTDHLASFLRALREFEPLTGREIRGELEAGWDLLAALVEGGGDSGWAQSAASAETLSQRLAEFRKEHRKTILESTAMRQTNPADAWRQIEAIKLLDRLGYHAWRALHYLEEADQDLEGR